MTVPTYDKFIEPVFRFLAAHPDGAPAREVHAAAADALGLSEEDRKVVVPSGSQMVYKNRASWAHDRLKRAGYSSTPRHGFWQITSAGSKFLNSHPQPFSSKTVESLATEFIDVRLRKAVTQEGDGHPDSESTAIQNLVSVQNGSTTSPDDRLEAAWVEIKSSVARELLELLARVSPTYFETVVLDVLHKIGYGASRSDLQRVGGSGDGGIDGVISLDRLGLEKVYVQAKRWQSAVGRPEVQGFYGALAGHHANKGVFITTSTYTFQALEFAKSVEKIVLVDGARLAQLMIEFEVGVASRPVKIPKIDSDYFDE